MPLSVPSKLGRHTSLQASLPRIRRFRSMLGIFYYPNATSPSIIFVRHAVSQSSPRTLASSETSTLIAHPSLCQVPKLSSMIHRHSASPLHLTASTVTTLDLRLITTDAIKSSFLPRKLLVIASRLSGFPRLFHSPKLATMTTSGRLPMTYSLSSNTKIRMFTRRYNLAQLP